MRELRQQRQAAERYEEFLMEQAEHEASYEARHRDFLMAQAESELSYDAFLMAQAEHEQAPALLDEFLNNKAGKSAARRGAVKLRQTAANEQANGGALDVALGVIERGWNPVPVGFKSKAPSAGEGWEKLVIDAEAAPQYFNGGAQNVGVQLGGNSGGLADADLDSAEAIVVARYLMPGTDAVFGRPSKRCSHQLYISDLYKNQERGAVQFKDPVAKQHGHKEMLIELRIGGGGKGAQTVFPPSTHESGEVISWERDGDPGKVVGAKLLQATALTASAALLARYWPAEGGRHHAALILGGFLARAGFDEPMIASISKAIAKAAGDPEWRDRMDAAKDNAQHHAETGKGYGLPSLIEVFGEPVGNKIANWLDYNDDGQDADAEEPLVIDAVAYDFPDERRIPRRIFLPSRHTVSVTAGVGAVGKSSKSIADALAMTTGKPLLGIGCPKPLRVLLINLEDDRAEMDRRIAATMKHYGLSKQDVGGRLMVIAKGELKLKIATQERMGVIEPDGEAIAALIELIREQQDRRAQHRPAAQDAPGQRDRQYRHGRGDGVLRAHRRGGGVRRAFVASQSQGQQQRDHYRQPARSVSDRRCGAFGGDAGDHDQGCGGGVRRS